ncbi:sulfur carrier protein [Ardenticatena maritima]|uniref:Sulfur carrier protein n=1 Tax=Ardenticatena maritima TaxID=872965 RepID=A0A0M8K6Z5_9CHLR|nr:sulfur carrier protein ThiS [Ardenticatena maritima]KPL88590.1 thiamine biosynthesis protein ThiS [Ardenticatena maritima]GAP61759.1 sulfur carrier protein [Ardenticatena maritima]
MTQHVVYVNGEARPLREETVAELLQSIGLPPEKPGIAVAVNAEIVPREAWRTHRLNPNDRVEIVQAVAGG